MKKHIIKQSSYDMASRDANIKNNEEKKTYLKSSWDIFKKAAPFLPIGGFGLGVISKLRNLGKAKKIVQTSRTSGIHPFILGSGRSTDAARKAVSKNYSNK